ncbi:hypothetical protein CJU89_4419 [Yarrowia sp. B02]|nr:hypothetical protein CJU89_4419 [Yarrowia sp. B02]
MGYKKEFHKGKRLEFRRDEQEDWKISVYLSYNSVEVTSEYSVFNNRKKFHTRATLGGIVNMSWNYDFQFFFIDTSLFLHMPDFDTLNTFSIDLNFSTPEIHHISETTYFQLVTHFDGLFSLEKRAEEQEKKIAKLTKKVQEKKSIIENLPTNVLASMRCVGPTDFTICSRNKTIIPVHKIVMSTYWPHFSSITEPGDRIMNVDYNTDIVEAMVAFLYGQELHVDYKQAIELLKLSGEYGLTFLSKQAYKVVKASRKQLSLEDCVDGWKNARTSNHTEAKMFFARLLAEKTKDCVNGRPIMRDFDGMTQDETLELLIDAMKV